MSVVGPRSMESSAFMSDCSAATESLCKPVEIFKSTLGPVKLCYLVTWREISSLLTCNVTSSHRLRGEKLCSFRFAPAGCGGDQKQSRKRRSSSDEPCFTFAAAATSPLFPRLACKSFGFGHRFPFVWFRVSAGFTTRTMQVEETFHC